jgi:hypothetical protein
MRVGNCIDYSLVDSNLVEFGICPASQEAVELSNGLDSKSQELVDQVPWREGEDRDPRSLGRFFGPS